MKVPASILSWFKAAFADLRKGDTIAIILFLLPSISGFFLFFLLPFLCGIYYSFVDSIFEPHFAGFSNYAELFGSSSFLLACRNTLVFMSLCVPLNLLLSLCLALLVNSSIYGTNILRTFLVTPLVVPVASVVLFWQIVFDMNGELNLIISRLGGQQANWMQSEWAPVVVLTVYLWKNIGYNLILFTAGLQNIPRAYYEAASIEGAGKWRQFLDITLVYLTPSTFFIFIMSIINSFKVFREVYLMAGDYPHGSIYQLQHFMNNTFASLDYQKLTSSAFIMAILIYLIVLVLFISEHKITERLK